MGRLEVVAATYFIVLCVPFANSFFRYRGKFLYQCYGQVVPRYQHILLKTTVVHDRWFGKSGPTVKRGKRRNASEEALPLTVRDQPI